MASLAHQDTLDEVLIACSGHHTVAKREEEEEEEEGHAANVRPFLSRHRRERNSLRLFSLFSLILGTTPASAAAAAASVCSH